MKRENDEITDLFRSRLGHAEMTVREGFWEELNEDVAACCQQRRRVLFFRVVAAASVLLVFGSIISGFLVFLTQRGDGGSIYTACCVGSGNVGWR